MSFNHLNAVVNREKTLLPHKDYTEPIAFDKSTLREDYRALSYLESAMVGVQLQLVLTTCDGNRLFNSLSTVMCGPEKMAEEIKVRTCIQMVDGRDQYKTQTYAKDFMLCSSSYEEACILCVKPGGYSCAWTIQAATDVLRREIKAVYPKVNGNRDFVAQILNRSHYPRDQQTEHEAPLNIISKQYLYFLSRHHVDKDGFSQ